MAYKNCEICHNKCENNATFCVRCGAMFDENLEVSKLLAHLDTAYNGIVRRDYPLLQQSLVIIKYLLSENPSLFKSFLPEFNNLIRAIERLGYDSSPFEWFPIVEQFMDNLPEDTFPELRAKLQTFGKLLGISIFLDKKWKNKPVSARNGVKIINSEAAKLDFSPDEARQIILGTLNEESKVADALNPALQDKSCAMRRVLCAKKSIRNNEFSEAKKHLNLALEIDSDCYKAYEVAADLFIAQNDTDSVVASLRKAVELGSEDFSLFNSLAWYICKTNPSRDDLREALGLARKAVELAPLAYHWDTLAEVHERLNNIPAAIAACVNSIRLADPKSKEEYNERMYRLCLTLKLKKITLVQNNKIHSENPYMSTDTCSLGNFKKDGLQLKKRERDCVFCCSGSVRRNIISSFIERLKDIFVDFNDWAVEKVEELKAKSKGNEIVNADICKTLNILKKDSSNVKIDDSVDCTVFSPQQVSLGQTILVQVFAHLPEQCDDAAKLAMEFDNDTSRRGFKSLSLQIQRGYPLMFHLDIPSLVIDDSVQELVWRGRAEAVQFEAFVPENCTLGSIIGTVTASINSIPCGHVKFKITVVQEFVQNEKISDPVGEQSRLYKKAFISYAAKDRDKVLARVQMLKSVGIDYFQDIVDFEPGARWENEIYRQIKECDLFLLFWSSSAKESEWVMKEVKYALNRKGNDDFSLPEIRPVIIEGPPIVPPPENLSHLHFNDKLVYLMDKL